MTATIDPVTLRLIAGHDNTINLQAAVDGTPSDLTGTTLTAKLSYDGAGSPLALSGGSGLDFTDAGLGQFALSLTSAQIANMPVDGTAYAWLTVWNADDSVWGHGAFPLVVTLG